MLGNRYKPFFVAVVDAQKYRSLLGQAHACAELRFLEAEAKVGIYAHDFACGFHLGTEYGVNAGKFVEGQDGFFDGDVIDGHFPGEVLFYKCAPDHCADSDFGQGYANGFADKGHGARCPGIDFDNKYVFALNGKLNIHEANHVECSGECVRVVSQFIQVGVGYLIRGQYAGAVARVNARAFDVLHDAADDDCCWVCDGIDIKFLCVF